MKIIGKILDGMMLLANIIASLFLIVSSYSDHIAPDKFIYPSFLGIMFPFFLIPIVFFLIYWAFRRKMYLILPLITIAVCWEPVKRYVPINVSKNQPTEKVLKFITYNTCSMGRSKEFDPDKGNNVINFLKSEDPDIICLQEYTYHKNTKYLTEKQIRKELKDYPYYNYTRATTKHNGGLAVFSKFPITKVKQINYESLYNTSCLYEIDVYGKKITVINNHLESNKLSKEDREFYNEMIKHFQSEKLGTFKNTLISKLATGYRIRASQARQLKQVIDKVETPLIICGDFNDTPISYCYQHIRGDLNDAFANTGFGPGISYHENLFLFRIDHIFHSDHFNSYNANIHKVTYSDHYPMSVSLELKN